MMETTGGLRAVVEHLAASRGCTLEEVADKAAKKGHPFTADELARGAWSGFGDALDAVLGLGDAERETVVEAFTASWIPARGEDGGTREPSRWECPDPGGCVLRGVAAKGIARLSEYGGGPPRCRVGAGGDRGLYVPDCDREAVVEVYGIEMCAPHGEEAAAGALEEIWDDLDNELGRPLNPHSLPLSAHMRAVLERGYDVIETGGNVDKVSEAALLTAFPLGSGKECSSIRRYIEDPKWNDETPPHDNFRDDRLLLHRHMRLAFERDADWLVETLEAERVQIAAQAAYALALEQEAGLRPAPDRGREGGSE